ncbi:long-chain fatty acid transport protein 2-like isoform X2 [Erythrolamprus reginae]|uniref:long-chain fatty acid transport protein 2-like isoform X2 n=1 Tax=Erythrolamprus reginae TaxID=121349 RepID=UPI00396C81CF
MLGTCPSAAAVAPFPSPTYIYRQWPSLQVPWVGAATPSGQPSQATVESAEIIALSTATWLGCLEGSGSARPRNLQRQPPTWREAPAVDIGSGRRETWLPPPLPIADVLVPCLPGPQPPQRDLKDAIEDILPILNDEGIRVFYLSDDSPTEGVEPLLKRIKLSSAESVPVSFRANVTPKSTCLYIFTSGTTGLPKAAVISQKKALMGSYLFRLTGVNNKDIVYTPLPLYHSAGFLGLMGSVDMGATCVLRSKFSVSHYWDDCRRYNVTVIQYVGELMRYLCNAPKRDNDRDHKVKKAIGNGMRIEVWKEFLNRFGPIKICEVYGATEGISGFINYVGKVGAVGKSNFFIKKLFNFTFIQYDVDADQPVRDEKGFCIPVPAGQTGLMVVKISNTLPFEGYAGDYGNTERKILRNVLKDGDSYFNTGDLLMEDHEGFIYFHDRVGDTFRWKGENVATTEVEMTLAASDIIEEVNVYGVPVAGHEGKVGMAAIRLKDGCSFDGKKLFIHTKDYLPSYAIPRFIRIKEKLEITGSFKQCKGPLVRDGFNPAIISDPLFFLDDSEKNYIPMTEEIYRSILEKKRKL